MIKCFISCLVQKERPSPVDVGWPESPYEAERSLGADSLQQDGTHFIGVNVGCRATIFQIALALLHGLQGDADGSTSVPDTIAEFMDGAGLVETGKTLFVVGAIYSDMLFVFLAQFFTGFFNTMPI